MSPLGYAKNQDGTSFPRVSGDEPLDAIKAAIDG